MAYQPLASLICLPANSLSKLIKCGFTFVGDLDCFSSNELALALGLLNTNESTIILNSIIDVQKRFECVFWAHTLAQIPLASNRQQLSIFSRHLDAVLGDGIPLGSVLSIVGQPGVGKTQLCLQFCANVQLPLSLGGLAGKALYLDCGNDFYEKRMRQIADATHSLALQLNALNGDDHGDDEKFMLRKNLDDDGFITVQRIDSSIQLENYLQFLNTNKGLGLLKCDSVRLIIVDGLALFFRSVGNNRKMRLAQLLNRLAWFGDLVIIVTNQMTTRIDPDIGKNFLVASLGTAWTHAFSDTLLLDYDKGEGAANPREILRIAKMKKKWRCATTSFKHFIEKVDIGVAYFFITQDGVRDGQYD